MAQKNIREGGTMETVDKVSNLAHDAVDKATDVTHETAEKFVEKGDQLNPLAHEAIDKAARATNQAADRLVEKGDQLRNAEQRLMHECSVYIRDNPITSVGIAMGVGFILSRLLNNR